MQFSKMLMYLWSKFCKKIVGKAIKNSRVHKTARIEAQTSFVDSSMGKKSYCGYHCSICNCEIGNFCSISDDVVIGGGNHPLQWVSTSPAFYIGKDSITKEMAVLHYDYNSKHTVIGHDVWIGHGVYIKDGITIGTGAVIGMGSVVTKDVPPYAIMGGSPAKVIRKRFEEDTIMLLLSTKWWDMDDAALKKFSGDFDDVNKFLRNYLGELSK